MKTNTHQQALQFAARLILPFLFTVTLLTSCKTPSATGAKPDAQIAQQGPGFKTALPALLDYLATHRDKWNYDKIAEICVIDSYTEKTPWQTSWGDKENSPFIAGILFKSPDWNHGGEPLLAAGCYLGINQKYPLSPGQYAELLGIAKARLDESLASDGRFIESRYKDMYIRAEIDEGRIFSIVMTYEP